MIFSNCRKMIIIVRMVRIKEKVYNYQDLEKKKKEEIFIGGIYIFKELGR